MVLDAGGGGGGGPKTSHEGGDGGFFGDIRRIVIGGQQAHGAYEFDPETLKKVAKNWYEIEQDIEKRLDETVEFVHINPPGKDPEASGAYAEAGGSSGKEYRKALEDQRKYAHGQAEACSQALKQYLENEDVTEADFKKFLGVEDPGGSAGSEKGSPGGERKSEGWA